MIKVGILANPAVAQDVRHLVAKASTVTLVERCAIIQRALDGLRKMGEVDRVKIIADHVGIASGLERAKKHQRKEAPLGWQN